MNAPFFFFFFYKNKLWFCQGSNLYSGSNLCWEFFFYFYMWRSRNPWAFFRCRSESVASILCFLLIYRSYVCKCEIEQTLSLSTMTSFNVSECSKLWDRKSYINLMCKLFLSSCLDIFPSVSDVLKYKPFPGPFFFTVRSTSYMTVSGTCFNYLCLIRVVCLLHAQEVLSFYVGKVTLLLGHSWFLVLVTWNFVSNHLWFRL